MTAEHLLLIDAIMTLLETTPEKELQRRIRGINAVTAYCGVEEGRSYRRGGCGRTVGGDVPAIAKAGKQARAEPDIVLRQADLLKEAISSVMIEERPDRCFLCLLCKAKSSLEQY
jgi:hypothetical protein